ncbi:MAG TPA: DNA polymerase I [Acidimicrobiales bacterium]|nr:DNA polymerase I [Acidimicrobiales bacterium]
MSKILLLDGNSLTYRAFFALPTDMATAGGQVTNAVFGFTSMLINLVKDHQPDSIVAAFDRPERTFRHDAVPTYKGNRDEAPDILRQQMGLVREVVDALGVLSLDLAGFEADDIIATLVERAKERGDDVVIVTGDRDTYQLVEDPHIKVLYNRRGVSDYAFYDEAGIFERTGVTPALYPQYAALRGDPSDNLPGVPGVGEKTAAKLITNYGGIDGIYEHLDAQTPKLRASLAEHEDRVRENARVMVLRRDVPIEVDLNAAVLAPKMSEVKRLFEFLEFRSLMDRLNEALGAKGAAVDPSGAGQVVEAEVVRPVGVDEALKLLGGLEALDVAAAWSATAGRSSLVGLAVVADPAAGDVAWLPTEMVTDAAVLAALADGRPLRAHQAKPLLRALAAHGAGVPALQLDTAIAAYLLDPAETRYGISDLLERYTGDRLPDAGAPAGQLDFAEEATDEAQVAANEALAVSRLAPAVIAALAAQGMASLYAEIENPLVRVLARMEDVGIAVDRAELDSLNTRLTAETRRLGQQVRDVVGRDFNINSPIQLRQILYEERGLSSTKRTKTGLSTDAATLEKLRDEWPEFIEPLLQYREAEKLRSTYGEGLLAEVAPDGRIHATFNQTVARTGRLSSDQPNLHNIPVRSEEGRQFRRAFVPAAGCTLLVADYNQIELRCIAHLAEDPGLIAAFTAGEDIHTATASRVFGVAPGDVTVRMRSTAKMVSYGLAYGMEAYGLGQRLNIPTEDAAVILDAYFDAFPNVRAYMERTVKEARMRGYTETLFGRRRPIPELSNANYRIRQAGERQAMNAGIQGLAADIFKVALVRLDGALDEGGYASRLVLQVHDEVLLEVPTAEADDVAPLTVATMRGAAELRVPLEVNVSSGPTWADAKS